MIHPVSLPIDVSPGQQLDVQVEASNGSFPGSLTIISKRPQFRVPESIDFTGGLDMSKELVAFLATVSRGSDVLFQPEGLYRSETPLTTKGLIGVRLIAQDAQVFATLPRLHLISAEYLQQNKPFHRGGWNAKANLPKLGTPENGAFWHVSVGGRTKLGSIESWRAGDLALFDGGKWKKVPVMLGRTAQDANRARCQFAFRGGADLFLTGFDIKGAHPNGGKDDSAYVPALEAQHGISAIGVNGIVVEDTKIHDIYGDGMYFGPGTRGFRVRRSSVERNGRQAVGIVGASDGVVGGSPEDGNFFDKIRRSVWDIEPNKATDSAEDIEFSYNKVGEFRLSLLACKGEAGVVDNVKLLRNEVRDGLTITVEPPVGSRRSNFRIEENVGERVGPPPRMRFTRVDGLWVLGNKQGIQEGREGNMVRATDCTDVHVPPGSNDWGEEGRDLEERP